MQPNPDPRVNEPTVGRVLLASRGFFTQEYWFWICIGALFGFSLLFNVLFIAALTWLNRKSLGLYLNNLSIVRTHSLKPCTEMFSAFGDSKAIVIDENEDKKKKKALSAEGLTISISQ